MTVKRSSRTTEDDEEVSFELGKTEDDTCWRVSAHCPAGMSDKEFAEAVILIAEDILSGAINFEDLPDAPSSAPASEQH